MNPELTAPKRISSRDLLNVLGPFIGLALVLGLFSLNPSIRPTFLSTDNIGLVANQTVIVALGALGMTMIIISGGIDLSVGSVIALSGVVTACILHSGGAPILAVFAGIFVGSLVGVVNGSLITGLKVTPFIVTLGTLEVARGAAKWLAQEQSVSAPKSWVNNLSLTRNILGVPISTGVWVTLGLAIVMAMVLRYSRFGRYVFAIGSNETASRLSGLRVDLLKVCIYLLAGIFVGIAGVIQFARLGLGDPTVAIGVELDVIAACVIGGASLNGGEGSILGSMLGALIMSFLRSGAVQMGWSSYVQEIIIGVVIVTAVALDRLRHRQPVRTPTLAAPAAKP